MFAVSQFRRANRKGHQRAAEKENSGVNAAQKDIGVMTGRGKCLRIKAAINRVSEKESTEKQNSVARKIHIPSCAALRCCSISSNCS